MEQNQNPPKTTTRIFLSLIKIVEHIQNWIPFTLHYKNSPFQESELYGSESQLKVLSWV